MIKNFVINKNFKCKFENIKKNKYKTTLLK